MEKMKITELKMFQILLVLTAALVCGTHAVTPVCTVATSPPSKPIPSFNQNGFKAYVTAKMADSKETVFGTETYSKTLGIKVMDTVKAGQRSKTIFEYKTKKYIDYRNGVCTTLNYEQSHIKNNGVGHGTTILDGLMIGGNAEYVGVAKVSGIPVEAWKLCQGNTNGSASFTTTVYMTTDAQPWEMPFGLPPPIPVRIEVKGKKDSPNHPDGVDLHHIYDYVSFEAFDGDKDSREFARPKGVVCDDKTASDGLKFPQIPNSVSFTYSSQVYGEVLVGTDYFDFEDQLSAHSGLMYRQPDAENSIDGNIYYYKTVWDYNTGVRYYIDNEKGECKMYNVYQVGAGYTRSTKLSPEEVYVEHYTADDGYDHMATAQKSFGMDGDFTYNGMEIVRGILCRVYASVAMSIYGMREKYTFFFAVNTTEFPTGYTSQNGVNFQLVRRIEEADGLFMKTDYYNYDPSPSEKKKNIFDISACFADDQKIHFLMSFNPTRGTKPSTNFGKKVRSKLATITKVNPIRVHYTDYGVNRGRPFVTGVITETSEITARFARAKGKAVDTAAQTAAERKPGTIAMIPEGDKKYKPRDCAKLCETDEHLAPKCHGFDLCSGGAQCIFYVNSPTLAKRVNYLMDSNMCDHYQMTSKPFEEASLKEAWDTLQEAVINKQFSITDDDGSTYLAHSISNEDAAMATKLPRESSLNRNYLPAPGVVMSGGKHIQNKNFDDCLDMCEHYGTFTCEAFSYCGMTATCLISDTRPRSFSSEQQTQQDLGDDCVTYVRTFLTDFVRMRGITALTAEDSVYQGIGTPETCAKLCLEHDEFLCESFELCEDGGGTCMLGKSHFYTIPSDQVKQKDLCSHFSRNYKDDFEPSNSTVPQDGTYKQLTELSVEQCSRECSLHPDTCTGFFYSRSTRRCHIPSSSGSKNTVNNNDWAFYKRKSSVNYDHFMDRIYARAEDNSGGPYTGGSMAGLAFGMIFLGLVLGAVAIFGFSKFRNRSGGQGVISFSKEETENPTS